MDRGLSRRGLVRSAGGLAAAGVLTALAGCNGFLSGGDGGGPSPLDGVPAGSDFVAHVDVASLLGDASLRDAANRLLATATPAGGSPTVEGELDALQRGWGLDPRRAKSALAFGRYEETPRAALVLRTGWRESALLGALRRRTDTRFQQESYGGRTLYVQAGSERTGVLTSLGDGAFAVGRRSLVEGAIDVRRGEADAVSGPVRQGFTETSGRYARFSTTVPASMLPAAATGGSFNVGPLRRIQRAYGSMGRSGDGYHLSASFAVASRDAADRLRTILSNVVQLAPRYLGNGVSWGDEFASAIQSTEVSRHGSTVTVEYRGTARGAVLLTGGAMLLATGSTIGAGSSVGFRP
ncbi:MAG: hypothetical protein ABEJ89_00120 [Haloarculaceae archaeon]